MNWVTDRTVWARTLVIMLLAVAAACGGGDDEDGEPAGAGGGGEEEDLGSVTVGIAVGTTFYYLPAYAAEDLGAWEERGLSVEVVAFQGDAPLQQAMAAGEVDFGLGTGAATLPAIAAGQDVKFIAAISNTVEGFGVVARSGLETPEDLEGTTLGVTSPNGITDTLAKLLSEDLTGDIEGGIARASLGGFDAQVAALSTGEIDGFVWTTDGLIRAEQEGLGQTVLNLDEVIPDFFYAGVFAPTSTISDRPDVVEVMLAGLFEAQNRIKDDQEYAVDLFASRMEVPTEIGDQVWEADRDNLTSDGAVDEAAFDSLVESLLKVETIPEEVDLDEVFDASFVPVESE